MMAFGCAEHGDDDWAETLGAQALAMQPASPFAIHAVAHALSARSKFRQGALFMRQHRPHWLTNSRMAAHNVWHAAMFELESGQSQRALNILDECLMPHAARSASNALCRSGVPTTPRWLRGQVNKSPQRRRERRDFPRKRQDAKTQRRQDLSGSRTAESAESFIIGSLRSLR